MPYRAQEVRSSNEEQKDILEQINREFDALENELNAGTRLPQRNAEPVKPRDGMVEYADGTNWDPGDGEGIYAYFNAMWNKLANGTFLATRSLQIVLIEASNPIPAGKQIDFFFDFDFVIQRYTILADQSTTCVVDLWVDVYANYPPTNTESITAAAPVSITAGIKNQDATLTGWMTAIPRGTSLRVNVDSNDNAERLTIVLEALVS